MITQVIFAVERLHATGMWHRVGIAGESYSGAARERNFILTNDSSLAESDIRIVRVTTEVVYTWSDSTR